MKEKNLESILEFQLPSWEELPNFGIYREQVIQIVEESLRPLYPNQSEILTTSMLNNYVKGGALPRPVKKKYNREHLAVLLVITLLKPVLMLNEIEKGIRMRLELSSYEESYRIFRDHFHGALRDVFSPLEEDQETKLLTWVEPESMGIQAICYAACFKLLALWIMYNLGNNKKMTNKGEKNG